MSTSKCFTRSCQRHKHQFKLVNIILTIFFLQSFPNKTTNLIRSVPCRRPVKRNWFSQVFFLNLLHFPFGVWGIKFIFQSLQNCQAYATQQNLRLSSDKTNLTKSNHIKMHYWLQLYIYIYIHTHSYCCFPFLIFFCMFYCQVTTSNQSQERMSVTQPFQCKL